MYCSHCGKLINENKLEKKFNSLTMSDGEIKEDTKVNYVCPQCGHLIHDNLSQEEIKSLSRAGHAQLQRSSNLIASGMSFTAIGFILLIIAIIFYILANKPSNGFKLTVNCAEFYVSVSLFSISLVLLVLGVIKLVRGINKKVVYTKLLKDINNETFVQ